MISINISLLGVDILSTRITDLMTRIADLSPALERIKQNFWEVEEQQFTSEGGFSGGWKALSPAYAEWKESVAPGMPILQLSGDLMRSLTGQSSGTVVRISPHEAELGTSIGYAVDHQNGLEGPPARPPIEITDEHEEEWAQIVGDYIFSGGGE